MKVTADTDVLARVLTGDDARQSEVAQAELAGADSVALALPALCSIRQTYPGLRPGADAWWAAIAAAAIAGAVRGSRQDVRAEKIF